MINQPTIIKGDQFSDHRGTLRFVNEFLMQDVVRFYTISHFSTEVIRAWQGHQKEKKWFSSLKGSFVVAWVKIDNFEKPLKSLTAQYHVLNTEQSEVLFIPSGYANGMKALEPNSELLVFSSLPLELSKKDDYRYPADWWLDWNLIERTERR